MTFIKNEKGYTLSEMLIVFSTITFFLAFLPNFYVSMDQKIENHHFFQQLEKDLYFAQNYAMSRRQAIAFQYYYTNNHYDIRESNGTLIFRRTLPNHIRFLDGELNLFHFTASGNVNKFGNLYFRVNGKLYRLYISIGKGRFEIFEA